MLTGKFSVSANTSGNYPTSNIEKYFRRCYDIKAAAFSGTGGEGYLYAWKKSSTRLNGQLRSYGASTGASGFPGIVAHIASGTFVAVGS